MLCQDSVKTVSMLCQDWYVCYGCRIYAVNVLYFRVDAVQGDCCEYSFYFLHHSYCAVDLLKLCFLCCIDAFHRGVTGRMCLCFPFKRQSCYGDMNGEAAWRPCYGHTNPM